MNQQFWQVTKYASNGRVLADFITNHYTPQALQSWCDEQSGRKAIAFLDEEHVDLFEYQVPSWKRDFSG